MSLSRDEVLHIAKLARIGLSEEDIAHFQQQLSKILDYFQILSQVDVEGVPPTSYTLPLHNILRGDEPEPSLDTDDVLANASQHDGELFRVRAVLE